MPPRCLALSGTLTKCSSLNLSAPSAARTFTSTTAVLSANPLRRRKGGDLGTHLPKYVIPQNIKIPEYPYGASQLFKQQDKGLYGGKSIHFGNNVSKKTETKTRRYWKPNVQHKAMYSVGLKKRIKLRVTSSVVKVIDREGGLDEYLLKQSDARIKELGPLGWALRWTLLQRPSIIRRMRAEAVALGIPQEEIDAQWPEPASEGMTPEEFEAFDAAALDALEYLKEGPQSEKELRAEDELNKTKNQVTRDSSHIYRNVLSAANAYVKHDMVDNVEQGIQLALLRQEQRTETAVRSLEQIKARLEEKHGKNFENDEELRLAIDKYRKSAKREVKELFPGAFAYRVQEKPEVALNNSESASETQRKSQRKAAILKEISDAEDALSNDSTPEEERSRIASALETAQQIIDAESKAAYIDQSLARWVESSQGKWPLNSVSTEEGLGSTYDAPPQAEQPPNNVA